MDNHNKYNFISGTLNMFGCNVVDNKIKNLFRHFRFHISDTEAMSYNNTLKCVLITKNPGSSQGRASI